MSNKRSVPPNAYTDAPELHPNLILGSLQVLVWLFFHPSAWRSYVQILDSSLPSEFCLLQLKRRQWKDPYLRQLLAAQIGLPIMCGLLVACILWLMGYPFLVVSRKMLLSMFYGWVGGVTFSLLISTGGGLAYATLISIGIGFIFDNIEGFGTFGTEHSVIFYGLAASLAGSVLTGLADKPSCDSFIRKVGGSLIGLICSGILLSIAYFVISGDLLSTRSAGIIGGNIDLVDIGMFAMGVGFLFAIGCFLVVMIRIRNWKIGIVCGVLAGIIGGGAYGWSLSITMEEMLLYAVVGVAGGLMYSTLFATAYAPASYIGGNWAGIIVGAVTSGIGWLPLSRFIFDPAVSLSQVFIGLFGILTGLTMAWWRPILIYPFAIIYNTLLYYMDLRMLNARTVFLRWHTAFWDEGQWIKLYGLDEHLVLMSERNPIPDEPEPIRRTSYAKFLHKKQEFHWIGPSEAQAAIDYLSTSRQRWAAQSAQIELDARRLERCSDVEAVGQIHRILVVGDLEGPASSLLHSFSNASRDVEAALNQMTVYHQRLALVAAGNRLDGLMRDLTRSDECYAARFHPIAARWHKLIIDRVRELTEDFERRQEIDNPYVVGVPLNEQQQVFVGRADVSAQIEQLLLASQAPPLLLYGQRRMGKTSLLNNLGRLLSSSIVPLFVDLQGPPSQASDHAGLLYNISRSMINSADRYGRLFLPKLTIESLMADPFTRFDEWLDEVERVLGKRTALLALDEIEALDNAIARGRFDGEAVLSMLRHLIQHRSCFKVLLAASHTPDELQHWASYLINVQVIKIGYLEEDEARRLIERPIENFALRYEPDASRRALELTRGHPALTQLLCHEIVALKNEQAPARRRLVTWADVEEAILGALKGGTLFYFHNIQGQVGDAGTAVLRDLAAFGKDAIVDRSILARQFPDALDSTLVLLLRRDLIEAVGQGYRFQVELVRRWFAQGVGL